jgi:uncharacterized protein YoaH (UPF0181 family)
MTRVESSEPGVVSVEAPQPGGVDLSDVDNCCQHEQAAQRLRDLIADGLASGEGREATNEVIGELRERALGTDA